MSKQLNTFENLLRLLFLRKKFAQDFRPTFRASDAYLYCTRPTDTRKFSLYSRFPPFADIVRSIEQGDYDDVLENSTTNSDNVSLVERFRRLMLNDNAVSGDSNKNVLKKPTRKTTSGASSSSLKTPLHHMIYTDDSYHVENYHRRMVLNPTPSAKKLEEARRSGILVEPIILRRLNRDYNYNFIVDKSRHLLQFDTFNVIGEIDGIDLSRQMILEIKTRSSLDATIRSPAGSTASLSSSIKPRERLQVHIYMKFYNVKKCLFVEGERGGKKPIRGELKPTVITFDDEYFHEMMKRLHEFVVKSRELSKENFIKLRNSVLKNKK